MAHAGQCGLRLRHRRLGQRHARFGRRHRRLRLGYRIFQFGGIELGQQLALLHLIVFLHQHGGQRAGKLAADIHRLGRLQGAAGGRRHQQIAERDFFTDVLPAQPVTAPGKQQDAAKQQRQRAADQQPAPLVGQ